MKKLKRFQKVTITEDAVFLSVDKRKFKSGSISPELRKFAGMDAIVLSIDGDTVILAIDHDKDPKTPPIEVTVKTKYIEVVSMLWRIWLLVRGMFSK